MAATIRHLLILAVTIAVVHNSISINPELIQAKLQEFASSAGHFIENTHQQPVKPQEDVFVTIRNGTLKGSTTVSVNNSRTIYRYRKIPYAAPPVGDLRFAPPEPFLDGFQDEIYDATLMPPACPAFAALSPPNEDCLYLSVYTPIVS